MNTLLTLSHIEMPITRNAQMMGIKHAFDGKGLLNLGKVIPTLQCCTEYGKILMHGGKISHPELPRL
jgi:glycolate oxidase